MAAAGGVLLVLFLASPPGLLTTTPPVYHDEYDVLSPAVGLLEGEPLTMPLFGSTPALSEAFQGEGRFTPGLNAGFHVALALWLKAFGVGIRQARAFVFVMGAVAVVLVFVLGTRWWNAWAGAAAALLLCLNGTFWLASRQVRPETFTLAASLAGASILSVADERWRKRLPEVAGLAIGVGLLGHPVGLVMLPAVLGIPLLGFGGLPARSYLIRLALPPVVLGAAYGAFLAWNWDGVRAALTLHEVHRGLQSLTLAEFVGKEWRRYGEGYLNAYALALGGALNRVALGGWVVLALAGALPVPPGTAAERRALSRQFLFAAAPVSVAIGTAILARDNNFLYLVYFHVWLYLAAAAGVVAVSRAVSRRSRQPSTLLGAAIGYAALVALAVAGVRLYRAEAEPYGTQRVIPYERIERLLATHIPAGGLVIANEASWLAVRAAGGVFVFNRQYLQFEPPYRRYPVRASFEGGSHLVHYDLDIGLLKDLHKGGRTIFYVQDMWDWSWNLYAPFGRYAPSFLSLQKQLDAFFSPVLRVYTRDRGLVVLYRFAPDAGVPPDEPVLYLEETPHHVGPEIPPTGPLTAPTEVRLAPAGSPISLASFPLKPGRAYLLHLSLRVLEGGTVIPVWNGTGLPKYVDARVTIPLDRVVYADGDRGALALLAHPEPAVVRLERIWLRELTPGG